MPPAVSFSRFFASSSDLASAAPFDASSTTPHEPKSLLNSSKPSSRGGAVNNKTRRQSILIARTETKRNSPCRLTKAYAGVWANTLVATAAFAAIISSATTRIIGTSPFVSTASGTPSLDVSNRNSADANSCTQNTTSI